jgi:hypothetical protein
MAAEKRIYNVDGKHLVRAINGSQALRHVVKAEHTVTLASQDDIVKMVGEGISVEEAKSDAV